MPSKRIKLKEWDYTSKGTDNLSLTTKLTDMGNPMYDKVLLGYFYNITQKQEQTSTESAAFTFNIYYRINEKDSFALLASSSNIIGVESSKTTRLINKTVPFSIRKEFKSIQLKIRCPQIRGNFLINDFGIMYREVRKISVEEQDD